MSHVVLASTDLPRDRHLFESFGWKTRFEQHGIPTEPGKRPFMTTSSEEQALVFLDPPSGTPVELIHYADELPDRSASPLQIVLPRSVQVGDMPGRDVTIDGISAYEVAIPGVTCPLWFGAVDGPGPIVHFVSDVAAAAAFWIEGLGFKAAAGPRSRGSSAVLEFRSAVPQWRATLHLVRQDALGSMGTLDDVGFRCLSFVTSDVRHAVDELTRAGATASTGPMDLVVVGKQLRLQILRGPDGAFVEVFSTK